MAFAVLTIAGVGVEGGVAATKVAIAAEAISAGHVVRLTASNQLMIADSEISTEDDVAGVALAAAGVGAPCPYAPIGSVVVTSGLTAGECYYLGGAADQGKCGLRADAATGTHFATVVGITLAATRLRLVGINTDVQL